MNNKQVSIFFRTFAPMNKIMTYLYLVILTATGTIMTACSDDNDVTTPEEKKTFTLTVEATNGSSDLTRALAEESNALTATWTVGDEVNVYEGEQKLGTLTAQSTAATTRLSGTITAPSASGATLTLKYQETDYSGQDGTLATIGAHHNYCTATTTVTKIGDNYSGTTTTFASQQAIVKFTLKKKSDNSVIKATTMDIRYTGNSSTILSLTSLTANDNGIYYIAIPPTNNNRNLTLTVNDGTRYEIETPATTFEAGKYYCCNVSFTYNYIYDFSDASYTINSNCHALCKGTNESGSTLTLKERSKATLNNLDIDGSTSEYHVGIQCENNATINLKEGTTNTIKGETALWVENGTLSITGTGTLILEGSKAVNGTVSIEGHSFSGNTADGTHTDTNMNLQLVVSGGGNKWVISKKPSAQ